jgi:hypothetical protein
VNNTDEGEARNNQVRNQAIAAVGTSFHSIATDIQTLNASQDDAEIHNFNRF